VLEVIVGLTVGLAVAVTTSLLADALGHYTHRLN
jgi:hypothetical protein